jgi:hypothetical protein
MGEKVTLNRRKFVKLGGAITAAATAGTLDLSAFYDRAAIGATEPSLVPAAIAPMEERIRWVLRNVGIYPNENGVKDARLNPEMYKRNIVQLLEHLSPADLAAVGYVAMWEQPDVSPSPVGVMDSDKGV